MHTNISNYLKSVEKRYNSHIATEHSYRGDLENLISSFATDLTVTNEPKRVSCGAPDYIITRKEIPIGYIEAKDVDKDISNKNYDEQFTRYKKSLDNLIITNYLDFELYTHGEFVNSVRIGQIRDNKLVFFPENYDAFNNLINVFCKFESQSIKSPAKLSILMADKAKMLAVIIERALFKDNETDEDSTIKEQLNAFRQILIHDITEKEFADIYAQTIAYGMFAARLHDKTPDSFSRKEAAELIPKTNPFLRKLFQYISGYDIDSRIEWIVDALAEVFRSTDINALLKSFGIATQKQDPFLHFYETFLAEYNPKLRRNRGVWYTPEPVVNFIVRAVDDILKKEFNLLMGIADTSKTTVSEMVEGTAVTKKGKNKGKAIYEDVEVHKVQILDPATGTGTFLAEVVKQIQLKFKGQQGLWSNYVEEHLIPRINGFELLMAPYAMAHLKLEMMLIESGYKPKKEQRLNIYLTNSLEEYHKEIGTLFASWLSHEANEASRIKRYSPVMVILGNPPYSVSSSNKGSWIKNLTSDYKKDLIEKNIQPLSDDYIKFIRLGQYYIDKNGDGVIAYISNNSFIDGLIHRKMRKSLLESFDKIYILDLHGNSKKKELSTDGSLDQNVFDIMQGVSINLFIKTGTKKKDKFGKVFHSNLLGERNYKFAYLSNSTINDIQWEEVKVDEPNFFFVNKNFINRTKYEKGFKVDEIFIQSNAGLATEFDKFSIKNSKKEAEELLYTLQNMSANEIISKYNLNSQKIKKIENAIKDIRANKAIITSIDYRPFDSKYTVYTGVSNGLMGRPRNRIMKHMFKNNLALLTCRQQTSFDFQHVFISNKISERCSVSLQTGEVNYIFPLFLYPESGDANELDPNIKKTPNLNSEIVKHFAANLDLSYSNKKENTEVSFSPIDILDYIYAVLHSPAYRHTYKEFLKIDFPRIPYPKNKEIFWKLVDLGKQIRLLHLLESSKVRKFITEYPMDGDNIVTRKISTSDWEVIDKEKQLGRIWINNNQYFDKIPVIAWEFYIGGYQPAQKWLKDRKNQELSYDDILHYQQIIVALTSTEKIMKEIDTIIEL